MKLNLIFFQQSLNLQIAFLHVLKAPKKQIGVYNNLPFW